MQRPGNPRRNGAACQAEKREQPGDDAGEGGLVGVDGLGEGQCAVSLEQRKNIRAKDFSVNGDFSSGLPGRQADRPLPNSSKGFLESLFAMKFCKKLNIKYFSDLYSAKIPL